MRLRLIQLCGILVVLVPFLGLPGTWKDPFLWFLGAAIVVLGYYEVNTSNIKTDAPAPLPVTPVAPESPIFMSQKPTTSEPGIVPTTLSSPRPRRVSSVRAKSSARNEAPKIQ